MCRAAAEERRMNEFDSYFEALHQDCRHFHPHKPCVPHKLRGKVCESCDEYDRLQQRVCVVKLAATGDVLRTTSFLPGIHRRHPGAELHWLTLAAAAPLFGENPHVDHLHVCDGRSLPAALAAGAFDAVYCPDADRETAALAALVPLREGGRRFGYAFEDGQVVPIGEGARRWFVLGVSDVHKRANRETYQDLVAGAIQLPTPVTDRPVLVLTQAERDAARHWWESTGRSGARYVLGLNSGAGPRWPQKQWTLEGQKALIERVHRDGGVTLLLGGPEEIARHAALRGALPTDALVDAGTDNSLREFAARLALSDLIVTGDTMAMHMAAAFAVPTVALFGPTSPHEIELYGSGRKHYAEQLECLICYSKCDKSPDCQDLIGVDEVWTSVQELRTHP
jgi:ADP-heptose:LPS heptosyltransferase